MFVDFDNLAIIKPSKYIDLIMIFETIQKMSKTNFVLEIYGTKKLEYQLGSSRFHSFHHLSA